MLPLVSDEGPKEEHGGACGVDHASDDATSHHSGADSADESAGELEKLPCGFFMRTGTCAYVSPEQHSPAARLSLLPQSGRERLTIASRPRC